EMEEFAAAKIRGWATVTYNGKYTPISYVWECYCKLTGRPHATLRTGRGLRTIGLHVSAPEGTGISRQALERIYPILRPAGRKGDRLGASSSAVFGALRGMELAREIINPILDLTIEGLVPRVRGQDEFVMLSARGTLLKLG